MQTGLPKRPHPWHYFGNQWAHIRAYFTDDLPRFRHAATRWPTDGGEPHILIANGLTMVERRCALMHEIKHLERGHQCRHIAREERVVTAESAAWLLPDLRTLAVELRAGNGHQAARELWVTYPVLTSRLQGLTDAEIDELLIYRDELDDIA